MKVFKGFNGDMTCTLGKGTYQYEMGRKEVTDQAKTVSCGFHSGREPFVALSYYKDRSSAWCICEAGGDISEDETGRVSSTELTPIRRLTLREMVMLEAAYIAKHPKVKVHEALMRADEYQIVRGKKQQTEATKGQLIVFLQEDNKGNIIDTEVVEAEEDGKLSMRGRGK